jgi:hypothetical protein
VEGLCFYSRRPLIIFAKIFSMTASLKKVIEKIKQLPLSEQNALAKMLSEELQWQKSFAKSTNQLSALAEEALTEYKKGKTKPMN